MPAVRAYILTINSDIKDQNAVSDISKFVTNVVNCCKRNMEIMNKKTKSSPEPIRWYRYIACGDVEFGSKEGRCHVHLYIYCNKQKSIKSMLSHWPAGTHMDACKGSPQQNISYITKGEHSKEYAKEHPQECGKLIFEEGERPAQGERSDLKTALESCATREEFMLENPELYCRYRNGIKDIYECKESMKKTYYEPVEVIWNYGATGVGKTREAASDPETCDVTHKGDFFSDWGTNTTISLEEMDGSVPYKELLKITDSYHNYYHVNIKGGHKKINLKRIYISSSVHPAHLYRRQNEKQGGIQQLLRRITRLTEFTAEGTKIQRDPMKYDVNNVGIFLKDI